MRFTTAITYEIMVETELYYFAYLRDAHLQYMTDNTAFGVIGLHQSSHT